MNRLIVRRALSCFSLGMRALLRGRISARQLADACEAFIELTVVVLVVRFAATRLLGRVVTSSVPPASGVDDRLLQTFARVARHHPLSPNCLHRSCALQRVLARRGIATTLRIGVGRRPNFLPGHAWLETGGRIINDHEEVVARYEPLVISGPALAIAYRR